MTDENKTAQEQALQRVLERAQTDLTFRAELVADPKGVLERELQIELPDDADIRVMEERSNQLHIILPAADDSLPDEALDEVAGGLSMLKTFRASIPRYPIARFS